MFRLLEKMLTTITAVVLLLVVVIYGGHWLIYGSPLPVDVSAQSKPVVAIAAADGAPAAPAKPVFDPATYMPDVANGAKVAGKCKACHTFDQGGPHRTGPNQWALYGSVPGSKEGFAYSDAIKNLGGVWDDKHLDAYLTDPKAYAPGNKMAFNGIKDPADRADLIAWIKTLR